MSISQQFIAFSTPRRSEENGAIRTVCAYQSETTQLIKLFVNRFESVHRQLQPGSIYTIHVEQSNVYHIG